MKALLPKFPLVALLAASLTWGLACGSSQTVEPGLEVIRHDELNIDGDQRLGDAVVPTAYTLELSVDPSKERFSGVSSITVQVAEPRRIIYLHADESLAIAEASVTSAGGETMVAEVVKGASDGMALVLPRPLPAGEATLSFRYDAPLDEVPTGLYRVEERDEWYVFSQLEPLEARAVFPAFDEPRFKTPYATTLRVPTGLVAASNSRTTASTPDAEGWVRHEFAQTAPLPTYLVAFAVGPFDVVEAPADAIAGVPLRLLATRGKGALGAHMLGRTPAILEALTDYFGSPYPYDKLDIVAVPNFSAGAMENVGLVTFRETLLLLDPQTASVASRRSALSVMAHELAHMWFGNLVTPPWWDELWLNESFATWMARRIVHQLEPELETYVDAVGTRGWVMGVDAQEQARAIRQPIVDSGDVYNAFDGITYSKGAAVLQMVEAWIGEEAFRKGVQAYLKENAGGTGTTASLLAALEEASGKPVAKTMQAFLDQPGTPLLDVRLSCEAEVATLTVRQSRYLPAGSEAAQGEPWQVPMCVRYQQKGKSAVHCERIEGAEQRVTLPTKRCPKWIYPNADEAGYYRWKLGAEEVGALLTKHLGQLSTAEKVGLSSNLDALVEAQILPARTLLEATEALSKEQHRTLVRGVIGDLGALRYLVDEAQEPRFRKWVAKLLADDLRRVGLNEKKGEPVEDKLLRPRLLLAMALIAEDPKVIAHAREVTDAFLKAMAAVPADQAGVALPIAAHRGDGALWLSYKLAVNSAPTPAARSAVLGGLGSFQDPKLVEKSLSLLLDGTLRAQDFWAIVGPTMDQPETFAVTWQWFTTHYDAIVALLGEKSAPRLPSVGVAFCDAEGRAKVEAFFADKSTPGTARNLANTLERIERCVRWRDYMRADLAAFLNQS